MKTPVMLSRSKTMDDSGASFFKIRTPMKSRCETGRLKTVCFVELVVFQGRSMSLNLQVAAWFS